MSSIAKKEKRLQKAGYTTRKGQFGAVRIMKGGAKKQVKIYSDRNYLIINNPRKYRKTDRIIKIEKSDDIKILDSNRRATNVDMKSTTDITRENPFISHNGSKIPLYDFIENVFQDWRRGGEEVITKENIHRYFPRYYYKIFQTGTGGDAYKSWENKYISSFEKLDHNVSGLPVIYSIKLNDGNITYIKRLNVESAWTGGQDTLQVQDTQNKLINKKNKTVDLVVELKSDYVPDFKDIIGVVKMKPILKNLTNDNKQFSNANYENYDSSLATHKRNLGQVIERNNTDNSDPFKYIGNNNLG